MKLSTKSVAILLLALGVAFSVSGFLHVQNERHVLTGLMKKHGKAVSHSIAASCIEFLLSEDYPLLDTFLETIRKEIDDIIFLEVKHQGKTVSTYFNTNADIADNVVFDSDVLVSVEHGKTFEKIGEVRVGLSDRENKLIIASRLRELLTITVSVFLALALIEIFLIHKIVITPIRKLAAGFDRVAKGELANHVKIESRDEIGDLAAAFNKMTEELQETTVSRNYVDNIISHMMNSLIVLSQEGNIRTVNQASLTLLGYTKDELINQPVEKILEKKPSCSEPIINNLSKNESSPITEKTLLSKTGKKIPVILSASTMTDANEDIKGIICIALDITERRKAENQIMASLKEKEILLQEIHHRVKNNLQVIISLLRLQSKDLKDQKIIQLFKENEDRINTMALIHEKIYRSENLAGIRIREYIKDLANDIFKSYNISQSGIELKVDIEDISIGIDTSIPCGLIINELLSNSLKYAFPDNRKGEIKIEIHKADDGKIELVFSDNGIGLPDDFDFRNSNRFGFQIIVDLVEYKLMGKIRLIQNEGTQFRIRFEEIKYKVRI